MKLAKGLVPNGDIVWIKSHRWILQKRLSLMSLNKRQKGNCIVPPRADEFEANNFSVHTRAQAAQSQTQYRTFHT
jgi:hypothetical protein